MSQGHLSMASDSCASVIRRRAIRLVLKCVTVVDVPGASRKWPRCTEDSVLALALAPTHPHPQRNLGFLQSCTHQLFPATRRVKTHLMASIYTCVHGIAIHTQAAFPCPPCAHDAAHKPAARVLLQCHNMLIAAASAEEATYPPPARVVNAGSRS